jgi:hypothetical protein
MAAPPDTGGAIGVVADRGWQPVVTEFETGVDISTIHSRSGVVTETVTNVLNATPEALTSVVSDATMLAALNTDSAVVVAFTDGTSTVYLIVASDPALTINALTAMGLSPDNATIISNTNTTFDAPILGITRGFDTVVATGVQHQSLANLPDSSLVANTNTQFGVVYAVGVLSPSSANALNSFTDGVILGSNSPERPDSALVSTTNDATLNAMAGPALSNNVVANTAPPTYTIGSAIKFAVPISGVVAFVGGAVTAFPDVIIGAFTVPTVSASGDLPERPVTSAGGDLLGILAMMLLVCAVHFGVRLLAPTGLLRRYSGHRVDVGLVAR